MQSIKNNMSATEKLLTQVGALEDLKKAKAEGTAAQEVSAPPSGVDAEKVDQATLERELSDLMGIVGIAPGRVRKMSTALSLLKELASTDPERHVETLFEAVFNRPISGGPPTREEIGTEQAKINALPEGSKGQTLRQQRLDFLLELSAYRGIRLAKNGADLDALGPVMGRNLNAEMLQEARQSKAEGLIRNIELLTKPSSGDAVEWALEPNAAEVFMRLANDLDSKTALHTQIEMALAQLLVQVDGLERWADPFIEALGWNTSELPIEQAKNALARRDLLMALRQGDLSTASGIVDRNKSNPSFQGFLQENWNVIPSGGRETGSIGERLVGAKSTLARSDDFRKAAAIVDYAFPDKAQDEHINNKTLLLLGAKTEIVTQLQRMDGEMHSVVVTLATEAADLFKFFDENTSDLREHFDFGAGKKEISRQAADRFREVNYADDRFALLAMVSDDDLEGLKPAIEHAVDNPTTTVLGDNAIAALADAADRLGDKGLQDKVWRLQVQHAAVVPVNPEREGKRPLPKREGVRPREVLAQLTLERMRSPGRTQSADPLDKEVQTVLDTLMSIYELDWNEFGQSATSADFWTTSHLTNNHQSEIDNILATRVRNSLKLLAHLGPAQKIPEDAQTPHEASPLEIEAIVARGGLDRISNFGAEAKPVLQVAQRAIMNLLRKADLSDEDKHNAETLIERLNDLGGLSLEELKGETPVTRLYGEGETPNLAAILRGVLDQPNVDESSGAAHLVKRVLNDLKPGFIEQRQLESCVHGAVRKVAEAYREGRGEEVGLGEMDRFQAFTELAGAIRVVEENLGQKFLTIGGPGQFTPASDQRFGTDTELISLS